ncbi:hypothetical protein B0H15DRAFT_1023521 [Mycena belliarum]|uniref:Uncharacterized protein n=1 Tax=Mycena belliarum TaxID=1033014 RepID=A0AAD6U2J1_9AGAR|nr:hypothetical protein B0H15DRAFT_1023521 [Mycena belliae]
MQFNIAFITSALLAAAMPAMSAKLTFFEGADCTGSSLPISTGSKPGDCVFLTHGGSSKSIKYSNVPNKIQFFISGGKHDKCTNGFAAVRSNGAGCETAPAGVNWESVKLT